MTAVYWIWKNSPKTKYKGVCHYRRHFDLNREKLANIIDQDIDVILTTPRINAIGNVRTFLMGGMVSPIDVDLVEQTIKEKYPGYVKAMQEHFQQNFFYNCNMVIAKEKIFNEYCEFVFGIILPLDDYFKEEGIIRSKKFSAYFSELITSLFFYKNRDRWRIRTVDIVFSE